MMSPPPVPMLDVKGKGKATQLPELSIDNQSSYFGHRPSTPKPSPQPQDSPTSDAYGMVTAGSSSHPIGANSLPTASILPPSPVNTQPQSRIEWREDYQNPQPEVFSALVDIIVTCGFPSTASDDASQASSSTTLTTAFAVSETGVSSPSSQPLAAIQASTDDIQNSGSDTGAVASSAHTGPLESDALENSDVDSNDSDGSFTPLRPLRETQSAPTKLKGDRIIRPIPKKYRDGTNQNVSPSTTAPAASVSPTTSATTKKPPPPPIIAGDMDILARPENMPGPVTIPLPLASPTVSTANGLDLLAAAAATRDEASSLRPSITVAAYAPSTTTYDVNPAHPNSQALAPGPTQWQSVPVMGHVYSTAPSEPTMAWDNTESTATSGTPVRDDVVATPVSDTAMEYSGPDAISSMSVNGGDTGIYNTIIAANPSENGYEAITTYTQPDTSMQPSDPGNSTFMSDMDRASGTAQVAGTYYPEQSQYQPICSFTAIPGWNSGLVFPFPPHCHDPNYRFLATNAHYCLLQPTIVFHGRTVRQNDLDAIFNYLFEAYYYQYPDVDGDPRALAWNAALQDMMQNDLSVQYLQEHSPAHTWFFGISWPWNGAQYGATEPFSVDVYVPCQLPTLPLTITEDLNQDPAAAFPPEPSSAFDDTNHSSDLEPITIATPQPFQLQSTPADNGASEQSGDYFDDIDNLPTSSQETAVAAAVTPASTTEESASVSAGTAPATEAPAPEASVKPSSPEVTTEVSALVVSAAEHTAEASVPQLNDAEELREAASALDRAEAVVEQREELADGKPVAVVHVSTFVDEEVQTVHAATEITKVDAYVQVEPVRFSHATQAEPPLVERGIQVEQLTPVEEAVQIEVAIQAEAVGVAQGIQVEAVGVSQGIQVEPVEVEVEIDALVALFDTMKLEASELAAKADDPRRDEAQEPRPAIEITEVESPIRVKDAAHVEQANQVEEASPVERPTKAETPVSVDGSTQEAQVDKPDNFAKTNFLTAFLNEWHSARDARSVNANNALCRWRSAQFALLYTQSMCEVPDDIIKGLTDIILSMSANGPALTLTHSPKRSARKRTTRPLSGLKPFRESSPCRRTARQVLGRRLKPIHPYKPPQVWRA